MKGGGGRTACYLLLPLSGFAFFLWYIRAAGADVVYSDYIRLVSEYLPDVRDPSRFFVPDVLTRIPASYAARIVNTEVFGYSVNFDRLLALSGIAVMAAVLCLWCMRYETGLWFYAALMAVLFSLTKWELLLNGSGWAHLVSFGLFFVNYYLYDRLTAEKRPSVSPWALFAMPLLILLFAGEYIASYALTMLGAFLFGMCFTACRRGSRTERGLKAGFAATLLALCLYLLSRHFAVWEHAGATEESIFRVMAREPLFLPRFFLKTFAGAAVGQETIQSFFGSGKPLPDAAVLALGAFVLFLYGYAGLTAYRDGLHLKSPFPVLLLVSGFLNHVLVTAGRWIFLRESYALSSRYAGQFMIGLLGMILIFSRPSADRRHGRRFIAFACALLAAGQLYTGFQEVNKAKYREENYERMAVMLADHEHYSSEELCGALEWHKDPAVLERAVSILEENELNVFRKAARVRGEEVQKDR